ncbi:hypothetical protein GCM10020331_021360 [Ectobacillus funiculus]
MYSWKAFSNIIVKGAKIYVELLTKDWKSIDATDCCVTSGSIIASFRTKKDLLNIPFMASAGDAVFANLALLFALGIAVGLAKDGNGAAALAGAVGYFVLTKGTAAINENINMAVLGGLSPGRLPVSYIIVFHDMKLPEWLGFFCRETFLFQSSRRLSC